MAALQVGEQNRCPFQCTWNCNVESKGDLRGQIGFSSAVLSSRKQILCAMRSCSLQEQAALIQPALMQPAGQVHSQLLP